MAKIKEISITKIFLLFAILLSFIFVSTYLYFTSKIYSNQAFSELEKQAQYIERSFSENLEYSSYFMKYLGIQILRNKPQDTEYTKKLLTSFNIEQKNPKINPWSVFSWITKDKILTNSSGYNSLKIDVSDREYFKKITQPWKLYIGKKIIGRVSNKEIIPGIMQINSGNQLAGYILFGVQISKLKDKIGYLDNKNISFAILDEDQELVLSSKYFTFKESDKTLAKKLIASENEIIESSDFKIFSHNKEYGLLKKVNGYPFLVFVKYNNKYLEDYFFNKIYTNLYFIFFLISSLLIIILFLKKLIIKPIHQLSKISTDISDGNIECKITPSKIKEINYLSKSISSIKNYIDNEQKSIAKLKIANQEAQKANASKIILLRSITHDIKNYIFGINGLAQIILDTKSKNKEKTLNEEDLENIATIASQTKELNSFVEDLLDTNQIDSGEFKLKKIDYYSVEELIKRMVILNKGIAIKYKVDIKTDIENNIPPLQCDIVRVKQILTNLINNAIKYNKEFSEIKISAKYLANENQIYFSIKDSGIGISEDEIKNILSGRLEKNTSKTSKIIDSHGIGMPIVLHLLKLHNAKIEIISKENIGTEVKLYFPVNNSENSATQTKETNKQKQKLILMVEDNPVNIKITSTLLKRAQFASMHALNGQEALEILDNKENNFDLILMDGEMPVMNGYETTKTIRDGSCFKNFKKFKEIPIIGLMSCGDAETIKKSLESGMNEHVEKASANQRLLNVIARFLD
jgi:signal transduction histidine kinase/CheY-like chemotaxis protein